jgi:hypothetical protein
MKKGSIIEKFFSFIQHIFFEEISIKFRVGLFKNLMDSLFVIYEKIISNFDFLATNYISRYNDIVKAEIKLADITQKNHILVIGCGSIPSTPIILTKEIKAKIEAIDYDLNAVKRATLYIKNQGLQNYINILYSDGLNYKINNFNVIFILYGVKNQQKILEYISKNITEDSRVIYRAAKDIKSIERDDNISLTNLFQVKENVKTNSLGVLESFLLTKK